MERILPDYDNLRAAFEHAVADARNRPGVAAGHVAARTGNLRVGYESADWAERALELAGPEHPLFAAAVGSAARGAWNRGEFARARELAARAGGRTPRPWDRPDRLPGDVLADVLLYEGDVDPALATTGRGEPLRDADPIRLVWTLYYVAVCHAVQREPAAGLSAAEGVLRVAERTGQPDRAVDGPLRARAWC